MSPEQLSRIIRATAKLIGVRLDAVFDDLNNLLPDILRIANAAVDRAPAKADFEPLRPQLQAIIARHEGLVDGAGIAFGQDVLRDAASWLEWWRAGQGGEPEFAAHVFNPDSIRYYDYSAMSWFQLPTTSGRSLAMGPYIDSGGTDLNIVTLAVPFRTAEGSPSALGADICLPVLASIFLKSVASRDRAVVLVNDGGRVVTSNTARHSTGTLLSAADTSALAALFEDYVPVPSAVPGRIPWHVGILENG
jgi:hypothetical protein